MAAITAPERRIWLDFLVIDARCKQLGATSEAERAELLGIERSFLNRLRRGVADTTLGRVATMAERLGMTLADIVTADKPRPTPPPPAPKPPAGPSSDRPPAGPAREGQQ